MKEQALYKNLAQYYDLIYAGKDYRAEAKKLGELIERYKKSGGKGLLDVACGTGKHLEYLKKDYNCAGVDVNEEMLRVARRKVRGVTFKRADMMSLSLGRRFDVVLCLFSSIGYARSEGNLKKAIENFAKHLKAGGAVIIEPWLTKGVYRAGMPHMTTYDGEDLKIARLVVSKVRGNLSVMDMHYLVAEKDGGVKHFVDRHEMGLFKVDRMLEIMGECGLKPKFLKRGLHGKRGLLVGMKR